MIRKYRSKEEMRLMYERFTMSNLSLKLFSEQEGINKHTFQYWHNKFTNENALDKAPSTFHQIPLPTRTASFDKISIHLSGDISIDLPVSYSLSELAYLLKSIQSC